MKICFVIEYYYPHIGGFEVLFQNLAEGLVKAGHECSVVTSRLPGTLRDEVVNGVKIHRVNVPSIGDRYFFTFLSLVSAWRCSRDADIIETTTYNGAFPAWLAARLLKKPVVLFVHEVVGRNWFRIGLSSWAARTFNLLERMVLSLPFDAFICNSKSTLTALRESKGRTERLHFSYPGIDYSIFRPGKNGRRREEIRTELGIEEDAFLYLFFGRPGFVKGVEYLVRAVPLIKEKVPKARLLMILSKKPAEGHKRIEELIRELKLDAGKDIVIIDPVPRAELPDYINATDCVVVPSLSEGFGFTCVEACTMGKPVVATEVGSIPEVIFGKFVLVKPRDPAAIATGVERIYKNDFSLTENKVFLWEDMVKKHEEIYKSLLQGYMAKTENQ